jgi:hypothetical protein
MAVANLFERLGQPPPTEKAIKRPDNRKALLIDVLVNGPVPATIVQERGAAHGLTKKQLRSAREKMKIVAFKETGKPHGRWFWTLSPHAPE